MPARHGGAYKYPNIDRKYVSYETCGHNKLYPYKDGVLFNTLIIC